MTVGAGAGLTVLNRYRLTGSEAAFGAAIRALAARVEAEGARGVLGYRFFANGPKGAARAVIDYADSAAWVAHHRIAMDWPQMQALHEVAALEEIVFLGAPDPEVWQWLEGSPLRDKVVSGFEPVAGFVREGR